uniref:Uncharacterized protein n=1 Tax=Arundo donax TaxID=35708 RepID=A0A0A9EAV7_ARUDO
MHVSLKHHLKPLCSPIMKPSFRTNIYQPIKRPSIQCAIRIGNHFTKQQLSHLPVLLPCNGLKS